MSEPTGPEHTASTDGDWRKRIDPDQITQGDIDVAADLKLQGEPPEIIRRRLTERGLSPEAADHLIATLFAPQQSSGKKLICALIGGPLFVIGVLLLIGNVTGVFPTFPFAGFIVMGIGGAIWGAGEAS